MPRTSAEARLMEKYRPGPEPPAAPKHLNANAKQLWAEIIHDRPQNYFRAGSLKLLASFCATSAALEDLWPRLHRARGDTEQFGTLLYQICKLVPLQARLGGDLRLIPRATIERHSAVRDEVGNWTDNELFGGRAAWEAKRAKAKLDG
jgi:hypothetical protein